MHRLRLSIALTSIFVLLALPAAAADNGFYLGASIGQSAIDFSGEETPDFSGDDMAFKVFAGYRLFAFFAVEGSYVDFGAPSGDLGTADDTFETSIKGFDIFAVGMLPLGIADIFAKAGMASWDADLTTNIDGVVDSVSSDGTDPVYGVGVQFRISSFAIRGEVEYFDIADTDGLLMYSVGGSFTF